MITNLTREGIKKLPSSTGVYIFKNKQQTLYIGKALSIRARILSHLENAKLDPKEDLIFKNSSSIKFILTDSEFNALLLESSLIKKYQPKYNSRWKDDKSYLYIKISKKDFLPKVLIVRKESDSKSVYYGPFPSRLSAEKIVRTIRRLFPFCTQKNITSQACFYSKIGLCNPCPNLIVRMSDTAEKKRMMKKYLYSIRQLQRILKGKVDLVVKESYKKLADLTKQQAYEQAIVVRNNIQLFEQLIRQTRFSSETSAQYNKSAESQDKLQKMLSYFFPAIQKLNRIECYDVSNLLQKEATASMVVFSLGMPDNAEYRRFRLKSLNLRSDFEMLEETFRRRFKNNWPQPDLLIVDGGTPQVLKVKRVLHNLKINIPLIGIAKHPDRLIISAPKGITSIKPSIDNLGFNLVRAARDEAHRFARKYHLLLRQQKMLI